MTTFRLTEDGIERAREAHRQGIMKGDKIPTAIVCKTLRAAMVFWWGRGIPVDPNDITWDLNRTEAN